MDFSFLKPVDLWFWFFFIISFIIIVYTLIFIKNHSEIKFLIILRSITFVIFTFLLLKPKFSWTQYNYNNLDQEIKNITDFNNISKKMGEIGFIRHMSLSIDSGDIRINFSKLFLSISTMLIFQLIFLKSLTLKNTI